MPPIPLSLSVPEVNLVLEALGRLPYVQVYELIAKIHEQAEPPVRAVGTAGDGATAVTVAAAS